MSEEVQKISTKLKKDDQVMVISGREKGKVGRVLKVDTKKARVLIEGVNLVKKAVRKKNQQDRGGIIELEASVHISNVMLVDGKGKPTRVGYKVDGDKKVRIAKTTGDKL